jgi:hypothetical protein
MNPKELQFRISFLLGLSLCLFTFCIFSTKAPRATVVVYYFRGKDANAYSDLLCREWGLPEALLSVSPDKSITDW